MYLHHATPAGAPRRSDGRSLRTFALVAVPSGWILLGIPVALGIEVAPFVLLTLLIGLVLPAVVLTRRDPERSMAVLLRECFRPPRPRWVIAAALLAVPAVSWVVASCLGGAEEIDRGVLIGFLVHVVSSVLIINLWEEMAWMGFYQRRAISRWGVVQGSLVTAVMFVGIHLPLAFVDAGDAQGLLVNVCVLVASSIGLRLLLGFTDRASGGSILTVAILHASWNATDNLLDADHDWVRYVVTIAWGIAAAATPGMGSARARTAVAA